MKPETSKLSLGLGVGGAVVLVLFLSKMGHPAVVELRAADVREASGIQGGLCSRLGTTDGQLEVELTNGGRMLVHGLALDMKTTEAARQTIQAKGLYGLATVERATSLTQLPYADNLVNLLIADLDQLGEKAPPEAEIRRVLVPRGIAYLKKNGRWEKTVKPRTPEMDDWTHFDHDSEATGCSNDKVVKPPTFAQWIFTGQPAVVGGNPAAYRPLTGVRIAEGRAFFEWSPQGNVAAKDRRESFFTGCDSFNGLPLWTIQNHLQYWNKEYQFVAGGGMLFTYLEKGKPLVALDPQTGRITQTYDKGAVLRDEQTVLRYCDGTLIQLDNKEIYALDAKSGALRWKYSEEKGPLEMPVVSARQNQVFALVAETARLKLQDRWPYTRVQAIVCLELSSGKVLWRNTEIAGSSIGQMIPSDGRLALFGSVGIGGSKDAGTVGCLNAADGKLLWKEAITGGSVYAKQTWGLNAVVRDGTVYYASPWQVYRFDLKAGKKELFWGSGYNQRCNRFCATSDWFITGLVTYIDPQGRGQVQSISRSGCAQGATPANGLLYFTPNTCTCLSMIRGHVALSPEPLRQPVAAEKRLEKDGTAPAEGNGGPPSARSPTLPDGPIAAEWLRAPRTRERETVPVTNVGKKYVAVVHEHRLECRNGEGKTTWSFSAGGRISSPPVLHEGLCLFGSHDGWVYAIKAADGTLVWRFLAAPYERRMVVDGQLESSWPVYGVAIHKGTVCASAGLHPETGGGIFLYGLEPASGKVIWAKTMRKTPIIYTVGDRTKIVPNRILNDVLKSDGNCLSLPGISFTPTDSNADIQAKVDHPSQPR
jgi:outer membrane protein assembly factor BamB